MASDPNRDEFDDANDARRDAGALTVEIERLAALPLTEEVFQRRQVATRFKIPIADICKLIRAARKAAETRAKAAQAEAAARAYQQQKAEAEAEAESAAPADDESVGLYKSARLLLEADSVLAKLRKHLTEHEGYAGDTAPPSAPTFRSAPAFANGRSTFTVKRRRRPARIFR